MIPQYRFDDFVDLAVGEIWHYGSGAAQIPEKIARLLSDIDQAALPEHRPAVARWLRRIQEAARPPAAGPRPQLGPASRAGCGNRFRKDHRSPAIDAPGPAIDAPGPAISFSRCIQGEKQ